MNILNVNMSLDPVTGGGTAERTQQVSRALVKAGHNCTILTTDIGFTKEQADRLTGVNVIDLPCINKRFYLPRLSYKKVSKIIADADVVHIMGHWTFINALVYIIARQQKKPYVVCPAGALPLYGRSKIIKKLYNMIIGKKIIRNAHGHIAITSDEVKQFIPYGVAANDITIISNGINIDDFKDARTGEFRDKYGLGQTPFILFMGRLNLIKGPDLLLRAFCRISDVFPDLHLVFAGPDGGMLSELKLCTSALSLEKRVHFVGHLEGANKVSAYSSASLLVVPSRQEAMSIVALESGICGVPVLMTDQCGFGTLPLIGGGITVPASEPGLADGLIRLLEDRELLPIMGERFRSYILNNLTWKVAAKAHLDMFRKIGGVDV